MSCKLTERVSQMIDGELTPEEASEVNLHIADCPVCDQALRDFLSLRQQIVAYEFRGDAVSQQQALRRILRAYSVPFWRRKFALPAPILALTCLLLLFLIAWATLQRINRPPPGAGLTRGTNAPDPYQEGRGAESRFDLTRFDHGQRAEIFTAKRTGAGAAQQ